MNASFFPEQLKHCMYRLLEFGRRGSLFLLFCCPSLGGFPWWAEGHAQWEDRSGRWFIKANSVECRGPPSWKGNETATNREAGETEQGQRSLSLEMTFAWHLNCHLLPGQRKPALVLTWDTKWWMGLSEGMTHRETFSNRCAWIRANRGLGPATARLKVVFALQWPECMEGGCHSGDSTHPCPTAAVFSLPFRGDEGLRGERVFLSWQSTDDPNFLEFNFLFCMLAGWEDNYLQNCK